jgi:hypothetical protein
VKCHCFLIPFIFFFFFSKGPARQQSLFFLNVKEKSFFTLVTGLHKPAGNSTENQPDFIFRYRNFGCIGRESSSCCTRKSFASSSYAKEMLPPGRWTEKACFCFFVLLRTNIYQQHGKPFAER